MNLLLTWLMEFIVFATGLMFQFGVRFSSGFGSKTSPHIIYVDVLSGFILLFVLRTTLQLVACNLLFLYFARPALSQVWDSGHSPFNRNLGVLCEFVDGGRFRESSLSAAPSLGENCVGSLCQSADSGTVNVEGSPLLLFKGSSDPNLKGVTREKKSNGQNVGRDSTFLSLNCRNIAPGRSILCSPDGQRIPMTWQRVGGEVFKVT